MNRNLVLKTITDKNGVHSSRWVKPDGTSAGSRSLLPSPVPSAPSKSDREQRESLIHSLTDTIHNIEEDAMALFSEEPRISFDDLNEKLSGYETRTLQIISDNMRTDFGLDTLVAHMLLDLEATEPQIRQIMTFRGCFDFHNYQVVDEIDGFTQGLRCYDIFGDDEELSELTGDRMEQARALCKVGQAVRNVTPEADSVITPYPEYSIVDKELVQIVIDNAHRAEDIARVIKARRTTDAAFIRDYLADGTPLVDGSL